MSISTKTASVIEQNWESVKAEMRHTWDKLSDKQVAGIKTYDDLVKALKETYKISEGEVIDKINDFIEKSNLQLNLTRFEELKEALYKSASEAKEKIGKTVKDSMEVIQEKTVDLKEVASTYIKENPFKAVGLGILATLIIKKLLIRKKD